MNKNKNIKSQTRIKETLTLASINTFRCNNFVYMCAWTCTYKHFANRLMKANTEYYVVLINNQITDFTKLSLVNICQFFVCFFFLRSYCVPSTVSVNQLIKLKLSWKSLQTSGKSFTSCYYYFTYNADLS